MSVAATIAVVIALGLWALAIYNRLVRLKQHVRQSWNRVDAHLKRRHTLISGLTDAIAQMPTVDRRHVDGLMQAQTEALQARGPLQASARQTALIKTLEAMLAMVVADPHAGANLRLRDIQAELASINRDVLTAAAGYNQAATAYNAAIQLMPNNIVAGMGRFPKAETF